MLKKQRVLDLCERGRKPKSGGNPRKDGAMKLKQGGRQFRQKIVFE